MTSYLIVKKQPYEPKGADGMLRQSLLDSYIASTMPKLIAKAKAKKTITYGALGINRRWVGEVVGEISNREFNKLKLYPSALVVCKGSGMPGEGFWGLPGLKNVPQGQKRKRWEYELNKVYDFWK